jgi:hypothetical protein
MLSETIISINKIKRSVGDRNNNPHSDAEICPLRLDKRRKGSISIVAWEEGRCMLPSSIKPQPPYNFCTTASYNQ